MPAISVSAAQEFELTARERAYLNSLRARPVTIAYSYELLAAEFDGKPYGMLDPIVGILENEFGLNVELHKTDWSEAFLHVDSGEADFYGPVAISEARRQKYIIVDPFYRSYSKIITHVDNPINSMLGLYNNTIGLLEGSVISRSIQTYLGPKGSIVYFPAMDDMIDGLSNGSINAFATVDNAEFEILRHNDIQFEFSIDNFFVEQGLISARNDMRPLAELLDRYIKENPQVTGEIAQMRYEALMQYSRKRLSDQIAYLQANYDEVTLYADATLYPLCYYEDGSIKGMQLEINEIFKDLTGVDVQFATPADFSDGMADALENLKAGGCIAIVGAHYDIDTCDNPDYQYSPLLWQDTIRTYSTIDSGDNLSGKALGAAWFVTDYLGWNNTTGNAPVFYNSGKQLTDAMKQGEVDAVFMGEMNYNYSYSVLKDYSLREVADLSAEAPMHMLYWSENKEFNTLFNESMILFQILKPKSMGLWKSQSNKYRSDLIRIRYTQQRWIVIISVIIAVMFLALLFMLVLALRQHKKTILLMKTVNEKDVLTGIYNRRFMDETLGETIQSLSRSESLLSVFMIDIDFFKRYNDTYGHGAGDTCLKAVADALTISLRRSDDFIARYGGEEFAIVLPHTDETGAHLIAVRLLETVRELNIPHADSDAADYVTISIGVTTGRASHTQEGKDYLDRADEALYMSKRSGRDRYTFLALEDITVPEKPVDVQV